MSMAIKAVRTYRIISPVRKIRSTAKGK